MFKKLCYKEKQHTKNNILGINVQTKGKNITSEAQRFFYLIVSLSRIFQVRTNPENLNLEIDSPICIVQLVLSLHLLFKERTLLLINR